MKRFFAALALLTALPALACAVQIKMDFELDGSSQLVLFSTQEDLPQTAPGKEAPIDPVRMAIDMQIAVRFAQDQAKTAAGRASVWQDGTLYQDGRIASMARIWQGEQADGREGSSAAALTVSLETGMEIYLDELFSDYEGAVAAMEEIISTDILGGMSDYMEYAELLPMPTDNYSMNETGLTVYWPEDRYRYFDGESGSVTFYWHELADYIGEGSPAYALAHPDVPNNPGIIETQCMHGGMNDYMTLELGDLLGSVARQYPLADPDYTTDALVFPLERERGYAVEIPKYAQTEEDETPICAIRAFNVSFAGLLTTGKTDEAEIIALLGEPAKEAVFDEDAAFDALLEPGKSMYYEISGCVLQLHVDESGVLSCLILRTALPESLF